jgi:hypothetical protein
MSNIKPKKVLTTDTDLYLNLLADETKIKEMPVQKLSVVNENTSDDDEHVVDALNLEGNSTFNNLKFQQTDKKSDDSHSSDSRSDSSRSDRREEKSDIKNNQYEIPFEQLPPQQQRLKRLEKFMQLKYIKEKFNVSLSKEYTINSDYNEMCAEVEFHTNYHKIRNGIEFWKSTFVYSSKGVEYLNKMFDPFGFDLNGWSDHFSAIDANSNDDIFGELYDKYKSKLDGYSVEFRAMLMFAGSAGAFVTANSVANVPGMAKIKETNPELYDKIKANVANIAKAKINEIAPSNQQKDVIEQNAMYQKMLFEKQQVEQQLANQRKEMERMVDNQQRIIEQQQNENSTLKNKIGGSFTGPNFNKSANVGSASGNSIPTKAPVKSNINSILSKLKLNLPKNDETSSVTEEKSSDKRILMSATVDSEKIPATKINIKTKIAPRSKRAIK